jgi:hypothetical protein
MEDFFMTITSSSDIWNFCWSQGGISAGRIDCDHAIFPYYTADKISDAKYTTGHYAAIDATARRVASKEQLRAVADEYANDYTDMLSDIQPDND